MIVHRNRSMSRVLGSEHRKLQTQIDSLNRQNKELRVEILKLQQRLIFAQTSKKKYKNKYKEAKQKIEIISLIGFNNNKNSDPYQLGMSPRTKSTRIKTSTEDQFNFHPVSGFNHLSNNLNQYDDNFELKGLPTQCEDFAKTNQSSKKLLTTKTSIRETQREKDQSQTKILQNLLKLHVQLQTLSRQIQQKDKVQPNIISCENNVYRKLDEVVEKLNKLEVRQLQRDNKRISMQKQKAKKRYNSSMKTIESIGRDLQEFKIQQ